MQKRLRFVKANIDAKHKARGVKEEINRERRSSCPSSSFASWLLVSVTDPGHGKEQGGGEGGRWTDVWSMNGEE